MSAGQGTLKHEVVVKDGENQLHVYLPKDVAPRQASTAAIACCFYQVTFGKTGSS